MLILPLSVGQYKCNVMFCIFFEGVIFCFISQLMQCIILWKYRTILPYTFPGRLRSSVTVPPSAWRDKSSACPSRWVSAFRNCEFFLARAGGIPGEAVPALGKRSTGWWVGSPREGELPQFHFLLITSQEGWEVWQVCISESCLISKFLASVPSHDFDKLDNVLSEAPRA